VCSKKKKSAFLLHGHRLEKVLSHVKKKKIKNSAFLLHGLMFEEVLVHVE
jgi:hypothetical protein